MLEEDFEIIPFPADREIVYVLRFKQPGTTVMIPFYVGESRRGTRRIGDYVSAQFAAATDFKVGVAVKALLTAGCEVFVSYQPSINRRKDEAELIKRYTNQGHKLLNAEASYDYRLANQQVELARIEQFVLALISSSLSDAYPGAQADPPTTLGSADSLGASAAPF